MNPADIIDLSEQLAEIRSPYPEDGHQPDMIREQTVLWGNPLHNDCGVLEPTEILQIELEGQKRWDAQIRLARTPNARCAIPSTYEKPRGWGRSAPSVSDG